MKIAARISGSRIHRDLYGGIGQRQGLQKQGSDRGRGKSGGEQSKCKAFHGVCSFKQLSNQLSDS